MPASSTSAKNFLHFPVLLMCSSPASSTMPTKLLLKGAFNLFFKGTNLVTAMGNTGIVNNFVVLYGDIGSIIAVATVPESFEEDGMVRNVLIVVRTSP